MNWNTKKAKKALAGMAVAKKMRDVAEYDIDDALQLVGLRRRSSMAARFFGSLGLVVGGIAVGTVIGLMLAPKASKGLGAAKNMGASPGTNRSQGYGAQPVNVGTQGSSFT
jgi:hypothetical protein